MPYCASSGKMAGYDEPEVEISDQSIDWQSLVDSPTVSIDVSFIVEISFPCVDCGQTSKTGSFDVEETIEHACPPERQDDRWSEGGDACTFTLELDDPAFTDTGGGRYKKTQQGFTVQASITCEHCNGVETIDVADSMPASGYDAESH